MKKILFTSAGIVAVSLGGLALANTVSPTSPNATVQERPAPEFIKAVEANDFAAFQLSVKNTPMSAVDTTEEFTQLIAAHNAAKTGDMTAMETLRTTLGLPEMKKGGKGGKGHKGDKKDDATQKAVKTSLEANDFAAFQTAAKDSPLSVVDTQEKFTKLVEAEKTMKSAHENMQKVRTELGIKEPMKHKKQK